MDIKQTVQKVIDLYPKVFFACHVRHVRDPKTQDQLSAHQASILFHLDNVEPTSLRDLASQMGVTPSTMSINTERLVKQGFVVRARSAKDARRVELRLTEPGVRIKQAKSVLDRDRLRSVVSRLKPAQRADAIRGLALLAEACQEEMHHLSGGNQSSAA